MGRDDHHAVGVADDHVAGEHRGIAAADRDVDVDRLMQGQVGRRRRAVVEGRDGELGDLAGVAKAAVGHHARDAAHHQPGDQDRARRRGARILAAVHDQHRAGRAELDRLALRMVRILEHCHRVEVLARRHVAQGEGLADHRARTRVERMDVLDELVAQAPLEEAARQRRRADRLQLLARRGGQLGHHPSPRPLFFWREVLGDETSHPDTVARSRQAGLAGGGSPRRTSSEFCTGR